MTNSREAFKREERYCVTKLKGNKPVKDCVVVEEDWPMYETVWQMIENYANGKDWQAALATVEQEPVAMINDSGMLCFTKYGYGSELSIGDKLYTHPQPDSKLVEENARLTEALSACLLMCDFSSIPAIETKTKEALKAKGE